MLRNKHVHPISLRWQISVSYFVIIAISFTMLNMAVINILEQNYISSRKTTLVKQANIISVVSARYLQDANPYINNVISDFSDSLNARILILNHRGTVVVDSFNDINILNRTLNHQEVLAALKGESVSQQYYLPEGQWVMYSTAPITANGDIIGVVFISSSLKDIYDSISQVRDRLLVYSVFLAVAIALFSYFISGFVTKPIKDITDVIREMGRGHLRQKVEVSGSKEIIELGNAFNAMSQRVESLDKARSEFVANASHELKTPLSSIKVLAQSLVQDPNADIKVYKEFMYDIDSEIDRMNNVINDLLTLVQLDKDKPDITYTDVDLERLINEVLKVLRPLAAAKNIKLNYRCEEGVSIRGDAPKLKQMLINIIDNALKYTPEGGKVDVCLRKKDGEALIEVVDNGMGIPRADLPYIFDRFYRVDKARSRATGGTGLGLSIAQKIAYLHKGTINVESSEGEGTRFSIKLPLNMG
ncbi:integral membrane sensor signal transduction histidine kinase [Mahella australiensis 50-1 BON]|uniref:histidine kinase n=2 Tax=Mahella TaxID=252965 RepID=F4A1Y8_MAHA5|nr:integral membrane sensor signal transduction histidine kinase [Mahella australiensis 50-1 BON]